MPSPAAPLVPTVDLGPFRLGDDAARAAVAAEVDRTCRTTGFLVVTGHGVPDDVVGEMYEATTRFFALPLAEKERVAAVEGTNGYRPPASSTLARSLDQEAPPDLCEFFSMRRADGPDDPNQWPALEGFPAAWRAYYAALEELAATVMEVFALALRLPADWFAPMIDRHISTLFANHYVPQRTEPLPGQLRLGEHTDFGSLTIVHQDDAPGGLQIRDRSGRWVDVPAVPGGFVVNIGDLMARWTNDEWVSTLHRVVNPPRTDAAGSRLSLPFFHQPNADARIECIPTCTEPGRPPRYEPVLSGAWRDQKVAKSRD